MAPVFKGQTIALSGSFPGHTQSQLSSFIENNGGTYATKVGDGCTHLVTSEKDYENGTSKNRQAKDVKNIKVVNIDWLLDSVNEKKKLSEASYLLGKPDPKGSSSAITKKSTKGKGTVKSEDSEVEDQGDVAAMSPEPKGKKRGRGGVSSSKVKEEKVKGESPDIDQEEQPPAKKQKDGQKAKSSSLAVPLDEGCPLAGNYRVFIDVDGTIFDAALNQTNVGGNNNKFYRIQLLQSSSGDYKTWTRWGRVGEYGATAILGDGDFDSGWKNFYKKFKDKSGLSWEDRNDPPKPKKYTFIERDYEEDTSSDDELPGAGSRRASKASQSGENKKPAESKLPQPVQRLMELIFNQTYFSNVMQSMSYDSNKLPLGKLSKRTLKAGFESLKELAEVLDTPTLAQERHNLNFSEAIEFLTNAYYTTIPHSFGRRRPPPIDSEDMLKREIQLLESLSDMEIANEIMDARKVADEADLAIHALDRQYAGLGMSEMTPLDPDLNEFKHLQDYLVKSTGQTHSMQMKIEDIFRIERMGENDRFDKSPFAGRKDTDRRLLWHGSRCTNFGGILSQGLRIAPPEAPVNGYMFGKGVYLADISSKSAGYCASYNSGGTGLLLLCEAELGTPMYELTGADSYAGEKAVKEGKVATWGKGLTAPVGWKDASCVNPALKGIKIPDISNPPGPTGFPGAYLQYNEFIAYDVAQIKLRYLFRVQM
ncbi:MAG: hypothetical protein M1827_004479 [Pycnora praestabilis]|nr:MAG: hypothetical protein M1827_004479 [Pycnora praestabilis]